MERSLKQTHIAIGTECESSHDRPEAATLFGPVFDLLPAIAFIERDGLIVAGNPLARRLTGFSNTGQPVEELFLGAYEAGRQGRRARFDCHLMRRHGRPIPVSCAVQSAMYADMPCRLILAMERMESGLEGIAEAQTEHGSFLEDLLDATPEPTVIVHGGRILHLNRRFTELFGYSLHDCLGEDLIELIIPDGLRHESEMINHQMRTLGHASIESARRTRSGEVIAVAVYGSPVRLGGEATGLIFTYRDIRDQKIEEARLKFTAFHDVLTGLANRALFLDRLEITMSRLRRRPDRSFAIFFLDLDGFKRVNDTYGHAAGDALLLEVADRLKRCLRPQDTVARFGGDEFAIIVDEVDEATSPAGISDAAQRLLAEIAAPMSIEGALVEVTASVGIALGSLFYDSPEAMMRDADHAMYDAKMAGKARHTIFARKLK